MELYQYTDLTHHDVFFLLKGLKWTSIVFSMSMFFGITLGLALALVSHARIPVARQAVTIFVELFRNSPVLVQLFLTFYGLPMVFDIAPSAAEAAIWTMSLNTAAFMVVILVSALDSIPRGQWQAAVSFGLSYRQTMIHVVKAQALIAAIPPTVTLAIGQLQVTSLVALIGLTDLTRIGVLLNARTLEPFIVWPIVGAIYLIISKLLAWLAAKLETRFRARSAWSHATK